MNRNKSIFYNFFMNVILNISSFVFPLITFPYISRILQPEGVGKISFATAVISYFLLVAQLGIPTYGVRACAKVRDDKGGLNRTVSEIFLISVIMCVIAYILLIISIILVPKFQEEYKALLIISSMILFNTIGVEWVYKALEMYDYITWRSIVFKIIAFIMMFAFVRESKDYLIYGVISIIASSASNIINFIYIHKFVDIRIRGISNLFFHVKPILIFFAMSCATTIYLNLDVIMLGFLQSDKEVGYYNAAVRIKNVLTSLVCSMGVVLLPRVTNYLEKREINKFKKLEIIATQFVLFFSIPLMVYFIIYAKQIILILSGNSYYGAILPMQYMMPTLLCIGLSNVMGIQIMIPLGKEKKVLFSVIAGAVINLIFNVILIPKYAAVGAAFSTMIAEIIVCIVQYFSERKMLKTLYQAVNPTKIIISTGIGVICSVWISKLELENWLSMILSSICFFGGYLLGGVLLKEDFVKEIIKICKNIYFAYGKH